MTDKRRRDIPVSVMDLGEIEWFVLVLVLVSGGFLRLRGEFGGSAPLSPSLLFVSGFGVVNVCGEDGKASVGLFRFE